MTDTQKNILVLVVIAIIALFIIIFKKQIGKWLGFFPVDGTPCKIGILPGKYKNGKCIIPEIISETLPGFTPPEGSACTTTSGAAGTIQSGVCVATPPAEGSECTTTSGAAGTIQSGVCVATPPAEGSACTTTSGAAGIIQNGICVATNPNNPPNITLKGYKLQGQNTAGAKAYQYSNGQFVATNTILGYMTQIISDGYVTSPKIYYRTNSGWFDGADMGIIQIL